MRRLICQIIGHRWHPHYFWGDDEHNRITLEVACTRCHDYYVLETEKDVGWELIWEDGNESGTIRS